MPNGLITIVADDLTGALDAAAPFARNGFHVVVATSSEALGAALAQGADVVAVSTRSREIAPHAASERVERVLAQLPDGSVRIKKIDSRLKGNIEAELDPFGAGRLTVLPAIPAFGRIVRRGCLQGFGVAEPISIRARLGRHGARADIPDTVDETDMAAAVVRALTQSALIDDPTGVALAGTLVGARGMTEALAAHLGRGRGGHNGAVSALGVLPKPAVICVGSTDPISVAQVAALRAARPETLHLSAPDGRAPELPSRLGDVTILQAVAGREKPDGTAVAHDLAQGFAPLAAMARTVIMTGGATAEACLDALRVDILRVTGEVLPGLPVSRAHDLTIVTKSGGFGAPDALLRITATTKEVRA